MLQADKTKAPGLIEDSDFTDNTEEFLDKIQTLNVQEGFDMSEMDLLRLKSDKYLLDKDLIERKRIETERLPKNINHI